MKSLPKSSNSNRIRFIKNLSLSAKQLAMFVGLTENAKYTVAATIECTKNRRTPRSVINTPVKWSTVTDVCGWQPNPT